jgi:(R,R)-butanediol dehydrogenase/meso-butanediol dehydrogenase/diacetyl reductase
MGKMKGVTLVADWQPRPGFKLGPKDIEGKQTYLGSKVWRNPKLEIREYDIPKPGPGEVLIKVKACGICGSDVHMAQTDEEGYILYPGLTGFPAILGHELSGVVVEAGPGAIDRTTNKPFKGGEPVCAEEMMWCGECYACAIGYPNQCERLDEIGFNVNGAFADYIVLPAKYLWNIEALRERYGEEKMFLAGSLVEPTSVAYHAVMEIGGGVRPGDSVVICGGGPIGLAAVAILKRNGAAKVILSEPSQARAELGKKLGADYVIDPTKVDFTEEILRLTNGYGANLYLEATGLPHAVYPQIEKTIWEGRTINSTVVIVARADAKIPVTGEVLQVKRAKIIGSQGHSGHGTFPRVIKSMAAGMDMTPIITKTIKLEEVPDYIIRLQTDKTNAKVTCVMN